ncbi:MAG: hypothetical protein OEM82_12635 [Acidobacteriota bacterium]|nr:hypothetical protein [Acidobacteriota bacterium]
MAFFQQQKPAFVSLQKEQFKIENNLYDVLRVMIVKIQPIRKFFRKGKLQCYSMDGKISRSKKYCVFCDDAWQCQQKIRLAMFRLNEMQPLVLDLNQQSFEPLQTLLQQYKEKLQEIPVTLKIVYNNQDRRVIEFSPES